MAHLAQTLGSVRPHYMDGSLGVPVYSITQLLDPLAPNGKTLLLLG